MYLEYLLRHKVQKLNTNEYIIGQLNAEWRDINDKTGLVSCYLASIIRNAGNDKEFVSAERPHQPKNAGQAIGTMYFIPREKTELAEEIFTAIDSITLHYTEVHPEQMFRYSYNVKEEVII